MNPQNVGMSVVEVDSRFRVTIPSEVRKQVQVNEGQKFYVIPYEHGLLLKPIPSDAPRKLDQMIGDFKFDRKAARKAEKWLLGQARQP